MAAGARNHLLAAAAARLQGDYARSRATQRAAYEAMRAAGAFRAPEHLAPARQAELGLGEPLRLEPHFTEGA